MTQEIKFTIKWNFRCFMPWFSSHDKGPVTSVSVCVFQGKIRIEDKTCGDVFWNLKFMVQTNMMSWSYPENLF